MYSAKILKDSIGLGVRLTTMEVCMPRFVLAEFNTHRMFSRNSASSRAIPIEKRIKEVWNNPFIPIYFAQNKKGMQAGSVMSGNKASIARLIWLMSAYFSCVCAWLFLKVGVHKQWTSRMLEPYLWHTVVVTATEWDNFFALRSHPDAQPEIRRVSDLMKKAMNESTPEEVPPNGWHLPYILPEDLLDVEAMFSQFVDNEEFWQTLAKISCARCARVSYMTHDTKRRDIRADLALYERLYKSGHLSPTEHAARMYLDPSFAANPVFWGNFRRPWLQLRKTIMDEDLFKGEEK